MKTVSPILPKNKKTFALPKLWISRHHKVGRSQWYPAIQMQELPISIFRCHNH